MTTLNIRHVDAVQLKRTLILWVGILGTIVFASYALKTGNVLYMTAFVALPFVLMLIDRPDIAFLLGVVADLSRIPIGDIQYLTLGVLAQLLVIGAAMLRWALRGNSQKTAFAEDRPLKWFVAVIIILMAIRGVGLRVLGGASWGGMIYVRILLSIAFYFAVRNVRVSPKQIKILIVGGIAAGFVGSLLQRAGFITELQQVSTLSTSMGSQRLMWLLPLVYAVFPVVLAIKWRVKILGVFLWLSTMVVMGMTGFRSFLVGLLMITLIYGFFLTKNSISYCFRAIAAGLVLWIAVVVVSPVLPPGLQRAVSFIPGAQVAFEVGVDAEGSVEWRVDIWKYCIQKAPKYLLIGRGSTFKIWETVGNLSAGAILGHSPWFAFQTRNYHSGPLTLLIDYGLPGLLTGLWLAYTLGLRVWKVGRNLVKINSVESRYCLALISWLIWELIAFFLVYGDMPGFGTMIVRGAIISVLSSSVFMNVSSGENEKMEMNNKATVHAEDVL
jgi:hypothetical protein